jgi:hypothetical protein
MIFMVASSLQAATTGKIAGTVKDANTGEPLPGANIIIEGTSMGASVDLNGQYFIINVPVGTYVVKATMIVYSSLSKTNVSVNVDRTTDLNFELSTEVIEGEAVTVTAERPIVEKTLTQSKTTIGAHELDNVLPVADINSIVETSASTFKGYIRGGRKFETKTLVDGVDISDTYFSGGTGAFGSGAVGHDYQAYRRSELNETTMGEISSSSVQELNVYAGTFTAEYPTASAGIVNIVTKSGSDEYHGKIFARFTPSNEWEHFGSNVYWMKDGNGVNKGYFDERDSYAAAGTGGERRAALYTWNPALCKDEYYYDPDDSVGLGRSYEFEGNINGPVPFLGSKAGFFLTAKYQNMRTTALPFDVDKRFTGNLKIHYDLNADMRVTAYGQITDGGYLFENVIWKFNPKWSYYMEGAPRYKDFAHFSYLKWTHTLSPNTFYEMTLSHNSKTNWIGYPDDDGNGYSSLEEKGDFITFDTLGEYMKYLGGQMIIDTVRDEETNQIIAIETYLNESTLNGYVPGWYNNDANDETVLSATDPNRVFFYNAIDPGQVDETKTDFWGNGGFYRTHYPAPLYSKTARDVTTFKTDFTSQVNFNHQLKSGIQFRYHNVDVNQKQAELGGKGHQYPYNVLHVDIHKFNPKEFAYYLQDRVEYKGMIVNIGARVDGYDTDTEVFKDDFDPFDVINNANNELLRYEPKRGDKVGWKWFLSPRLGVSHPVSDEMALHYSFGKFIQYPSFSSLYQDYHFTDYIASPSISTKWVDQDPIRSTAYEMGLQYSPFTDIVVDASVYYRDVENYGSISYSLTPENGQTLTFHSTWGHADSRGLELSIEKRPTKWWAGRINYAYSYIKEAGRQGGDDDQVTTFSTANNRDDYAGLPFDDADQYNYRERYVTVASTQNRLAGGYDRTHRFSNTLMFFLPYGLEASTVTELSSGFKYIPKQNVNNDPFFDIDPGYEEGPWNFNLNLRLTLNPFTLMQDAGMMSREALGSMKLRCFLEVRNLTNHENILTFNNTAGNEDKDQLIWELEEDPEGVYSRCFDRLGQLIYGPARQIWLGCEFAF